MPSNPGYVPGATLPSASLNSAFTGKTDESETAALGQTVASATTLATQAAATAATASAGVAATQQITTNHAALIAANAASVTNINALLSALTTRVTSLEVATSPAAPPGKPTGLTSTGQTSTSISYSWVAPVGGTAVSNYFLEYKQAGTTTWLPGPTGAATTGTVISLANGTSYDGRVTGLSSTGAPGVPSDTFTISTTAGALTESAHDTALTTTAGSIVDAQLNVYRLVVATPPATGFQITVNGVLNSFTNAVVLAKYYNPPGTPAIGVPKHTFVHQNAAGAWYMTNSVTANQMALTQISGDPDLLPTTSSTFTVANGRIVSPSGLDYAMKGVDVFDTFMGAIPVTLIQGLFPGLTGIRLSVGADGNGFFTAQPDAAIISWVTSYTNAGFVVMVCSHITGQPPALTGANLTASSAWYTRMATAFLGNPNVWFMSSNEVLEPNVSAEHLATYNAIRGTGNNTVILMCVPGGNANATPDNAAVYTGMHNVGWDLHWYNHMTGGDTVQSSVNTKLANAIRFLQAFTTSADGTMPVIIGETGWLDYAHDPSIEVNGANGTDQIILSAMTVGRSVGAGYAIFLTEDPWNFLTSVINKSNNQITRDGTYMNTHINDIG